MTSGVFEFRKVPIALWSDLQLFSGHSLQHCSKAVLPAITTVSNLMAVSQVYLGSNFSPGFTSKVVLDEKLWGSVACVFTGPNQQCQNTEKLSPD